MVRRHRTLKKGIMYGTCHTLYGLFDRLFAFLKDNKTSEVILRAIALDGNRQISDVNHQLIGHLKNSQRDGEE